MASTLAALLGLVNRLPEAQSLLLRSYAIARPLSAAANHSHALPRFLSSGSACSNASDPHDRRALGGPTHLSPHNSSQHQQASTSFSTRSLHASPAAHARPSITQPVQAPPMQPTSLQTTPGAIKGRSSPGDPGGARDSAPVPIPEALQAAIPAVLLHDPWVPVEDWERRQQIITQLLSALRALRIGKQVTAEQVSPYSP